MNEPKLGALARFQATLLRVLDEGGDAEAMRARLMAATAGAPVLEDYARRMDARMLIVAAELVKKWGRKE